MSVVRAINELSSTSLREMLSTKLFETIFPPHLKVVPQLNEVYELALAFYESMILSNEELIRNGAYFSEVYDQPTRHFLMCQGEPLRLADHSSSRLISFFKTNQFKTGYGTHGLFPYRGKFHPQMIKAITNVMGVKPGDTILDPMMGSGTVLIESALMGINSIGLDASPFCKFMTKAKIDGLTVPVKYVKSALEDFDSTFQHFNAEVETLEKSVHTVQGRLFDTDRKRRAATSLPRGCKQEKVHDYLLLAYLDAKGYSERSTRAPFSDQFRAILDRYHFVAAKIQAVLEGLQEELGTAKPLVGDARNLPLEDDSIDGIIFSPPYSFAIDYLENDQSQLESMGVDVDQLRKSMIGLRGKSPREKYELYLEDMDKVISECSRVLKQGRVCTILVGTNNNQLSKILKVAPEEVTGLDDVFVERAKDHNLDLVTKIERQITGMANTMRVEFIVMLQKNDKGTLH